MIKNEALRQLSPYSRVWIYVADRSFTNSEVSEVNCMIANFAAGWNAHEMPLKGVGEVLHNRILILALDEGFQPASGCSIDKSVALMRQIQDTYKTDLFNRLLLHVKSGDNIISQNIPDVRQMLGSGVYTESTPVVNTQVTNLNQFILKPFIPLNESWAAARLNLAVTVA